MGYVNFIDVQDYCNVVADMLDVRVQIIKEIVYPTYLLMKNGLIEDVEGIDYIEKSIGEIVEFAEELKPFQTSIVIPQKTLAYMVN